MWTEARELLRPLTAEPVRPYQSNQLRCYANLGFGQSHHCDQSIELYALPENHTKAKPRMMIRIALQWVDW
jgi:hypothetical protein